MRRCEWKLWIMGDLLDAGFELLSQQRWEVGLRRMLQDRENERRSISCGMVVGVPARGVQGRRPEADERV